MLVFNTDKTNLWKTDEEVKALIFFSKAIELFINIRSQEDIFDFMVEYLASGKLLLKFW